MGDRDVAVLVAFIRVFPTSAAELRSNLRCSGVMAYHPNGYR